MGNNKSHLVGRLIFFTGYPAMLYFNNINRGHSMGDTKDIVELSSRSTWNFAVNRVISFSKSLVVIAPLRGPCRLDFGHIEQGSN